MSGFNPFRPKRSERENDPPLPKFGLDATRPSRVYHNPSPSSISMHSYFPAPLSTAVSVTNSSSTPHGYVGTPSDSHTSDADDSPSSDDQSLSDPFQKNQDRSDNDVEDEAAVKDGASHSSRPPTADDRRSSMYVSALHSAPAIPGSSSSVSPVSSVPIAGSTKHDGRRDTNRYSMELEPQRELGGPAIARLDAPVMSPSSRGVSTANSDAALTSQHPTPAVMPSRPLVGTPSSQVEMDPKALAARSGNRERKPPPPPKSHHGKLISPSPQASPSPSQPRLGPTNRFSYHETSSETSFSITPDSPSSRPSQQEVDYFTNRDGSQATQSTESLRRSQSQHKRPPTPPLSRRHSQMRRSQSTASRTNLARLSMPVGDSDTNLFAPPSPGAWLTASPRSQESRWAPPQPNEAGHGQPSPRELKASKRASQVNPLPPLPPPRRTRVSSSHSNTSSQNAAPDPEKRTRREDFVPHPSNANDILADLSRLQKEVDDLRGHYEGRKVSQ